MISLLRRIFIDNWLRKLLSLALALILWFTVNQSLTITKTINNIGVRILNVPERKTIHGLLTTGLLQKKVSLTMIGRKATLDALSPKDIEVVIDASKIDKDCVVTVHKRHLVSLNPEFNILSHIQKIFPKNLIIKMVPILQEKVAIHVAHPIGEPPKGFQFIDIWPYNLSVDITGPEDIVKKLKEHGLKLTFNLSDIPQSELESLYQRRQRDVISFYIPNDWKLLKIPSLSDKPIYIDDPEANRLHIDFIRSDTLPVHFQIPVQLFVSPDHSLEIIPSLTIANNELVQNIRGIKVLKKNLFVKGVSELFLKMVTDMLAISVNVTERGQEIDWSVVFINPNMIEERYVSHMLQDAEDAVLQEIHPSLREEYLRNRFRSYMRKLELFTKEGKPLKLKIEQNQDQLIVQEKV